MLVRYFKEYYRLRSRYQDMTQTIAGVGLVGGIFIFWNVVGPIMAAAMKPAVEDPTQTYTSWQLILIFLGLPATIWAVMILVSLLYALFGKVSVNEALSFSCRFSYPPEWLKEKSDVTIRDEIIKELDERLKG